MLLIDTMVFLAKLQEGFKGVIGLQCLFGMGNHGEKGKVETTKLSPCFGGN